MFEFSKSSRLLTRSDFLRLASNSDKKVSANFIVLFGSTDQKFSRLGITVSKKVGNSVVRNRMKRLIREYFRNNKGNIPVCDYNIIARKEAGCLRYAEVCQELANALSRIGQRLNR